MIKDTLTDTDLLAITQVLDRFERVHALAIDWQRMHELHAMFSAAHERAKNHGLVAELNLHAPYTALCDVCEGPLTDADTETCPHCNTVWAAPFRKAIDG